MLASGDSCWYGRHNTKTPLPGRHFLLLRGNAGDGLTLKMFPVVRKKNSLASGEMGQWERTFDGKPGDLSSIPGTGKFSCDHHTQARKVCTYPQINKQNGSSVYSTHTNQALEPRATARGRKQLLFCPAPSLLEVRMASS